MATYRASILKNEGPDEVSLTRQLSQSQRSWVEKTFFKRECVRFIRSPRDENKCCCGRPVGWHGPYLRQLEILQQPERWHPYSHTEARPTDAFGTIEFQGAPHPSKAQYVRLSSFDTKADQVLQLLQKHWLLELPKLLITVHGGILNFDLQPKLKRVFRKGLLKAARTTGAWIITGGTNTGVTRHVGDAISDRTTKAKNKVVAIGIAPWGIVENKEEMVGKDLVVPYHCVSSLKTNYAVLNSNHSYFLLVDNGTVGKYGGEIIFRKRLEKYIAQQKISIASGVKGRGVPVICVVLEGGANTIRSVLEYVTDTPPVPVVVCDGSGRAADLLAFTHKYTLEDGTMPESLRDQLLLTIQKTFQYSAEQAEKLFIELMLCVKKRELITVFRMGEGAQQDIDLAILTALLKGTNASAPDQLSLALTWDRVDIARSHIFVYGQEWPEGSLEQAMMDALINDRVDFVKLLLENGVSMHTFLTIPRLEELYNTRQGPSNTLRYLVRDVRKHVPSNHRYSLLDIGLVIDHLMGGAFRATYCRKRFRQKYNALKRNASVGNMGSLVTATTLFMFDSKEAQELFPYPFHDLMIWAILMKRQKMALFMWQHGEEAMAKALMACKLYKAMAHEADSDDLEVDIFEELRSYAKEFQVLALELLEHCYKMDDDYTQQLLTYELKNFSDQTCLSLAVAANHRQFIAHTCCQILLNDMWMGGLQMRKNSSLKVILGILMPLYIMALDFKSKEELQLMPQTMEEHLDELASQFSDNDDISISSFDGDMQGPDGLFVEESEPSFHSPSQLTSANCKENGTLPGENILEYSNFNIKKKKSPLKLGKKFYEFYNAPITKFWFYTMFYLMFLICYAYTVLVRTYPRPKWQEYYVMTNVFTLAIEKIRQIVASEPVKVSMKLRVHFSHLWNIWDAVAIIIFTVAWCLRFYPSTLGAARIVFVFNIVFWLVRILEIMMVHKYLGPYVKIIGKLNEEPSWHLVRNMFFYPYWMIYGELFADEIDTCTDEDRHPDGCTYGSWVAPALMCIYLLIANILLINMLIARFNATFIRTHPMSREIWKFQRYQLVINYELRPIMPPPLIIFSHIYLCFKYVIRRCKKKRDLFDNGLKLFLSHDDTEKLHDFEEECVEDFFREKDQKFQNSSEERIRVINERVENMTMRMDDVNQKENSIKLSLQTVDYRLTKLEELTTQSTDLLNVMKVYLSRGVRHISASSTSSHGQVESQESIIEHGDLTAYDEPAVLKTDEGTQMTKHKSSDSLDKSSTSEPNSTMRSIPSPLLVHSKKPVKEENLRKYTDFTRSGSPKISSPRKPLERSFSQRSKHSLPRLPELSSEAINDIGKKEDGDHEASLHDRRHVPDDLTVDVNKANDNSGRMVFTDDTVLLDKNQSSVYSAPKSQSTSSAIFTAAENSSSSSALAQLTPILTSVNSEYTTITDEIDTSCMMDRSPPGSPSSAGSFFPDKFFDSKKKRKEFAKKTENARLRKAEEAESRKMEKVIRERLRQISLDETDSISDIAKLVVDDLNLNKDDHSSQEEDAEDDVHGSSENIPEKAKPFTDTVEIRIRRPSQDNETQTNNA
ncbi:hypothetical protein KUTeg_017739 [Tegillarca granosa]|uniref:Transient receptor potential cation channel subfamily M member 3 n=1 Tax=Tegillarca granosa TaxID=220873 RepID=A0ABQ9EIA8_TEGGR|nr:hypothetical protein KUTeg_017739 [Tegillarca granosa]